MVHQTEIRLTGHKRNLHKAIVTTMAFSFKHLKAIFSFLTLVLIAAACNQSDMKEPLVYDGPLRIGENVEHYYTEENQVKIKMIAALVYEFENGDNEFPKGIYLEFFNEFGKLEST